MGLFYIFLLPAIYLSIDFLVHLASGKRMISSGFRELIDILIAIALPILFFNIDPELNDCCTESASFSPEHRITIVVFILLCLIVFIYSSIREKIAGPIVEVLVNVALMLGIVFNIFMAIQVGTIWIFGNLPIIILFIFQLSKNHKIFIENAKVEATVYRFWWSRKAFQILNSNVLVKFPILIVIGIPVFAILSSILLIFGQQPDSIVRAFTDTYKHTFSQLDYECANVECGGHFLCSVGANGHRKVVKPVRFGERHGKPIVCNRQLLVSNAFEELLQEKLPSVHRLLRKNYNRIGLLVHRYYNVFNNKLVSDMMYIAMKPAEWFFLLTLYIFDPKPENRIARQYLSKGDKEKLEISHNNSSFFTL